MAGLRACGCDEEGRGWCDESSGRGRQHKINARARSDSSGVMAVAQRSQTRRWLLVVWPEREREREKRKDDQLARCEKQKVCRGFVGVSKDGREESRPATGSWKSRWCRMKVGHKEPIGGRRGRLDTTVRTQQSDTTVKGEKQSEEGGKMSSVGTAGRAMIREQRTDDCVCLQTPLFSPRSSSDTHFKAAPIDASDASAAASTVGAIYNGYAKPCRGRSSPGKGCCPARDPPAGLS